MMTGYMTLAQVDRRAKALGLSYGQYVAKYRSDEPIRKKPEANIYRVPLDADGNPIKIGRRSKRHLRECADKIIGMYGSGSTIASMAEVLGVSEIEMARFIKKSGLTREECKSGTTLWDPRDEPVDVKPCINCKVRNCSDLKMCNTYKRWVSYAWNKAVAPFRELKKQPSQSV